MFRQGDVLFVVAKAVPKGVIHVQDGVVAYGEHTGHAHVVSGGVVFRDSESQRLFVRVMRGTATVVHEEHKPITLGPGVYEVVSQREYSPTEIRRVSD